MTTIKVEDLLFTGFAYGQVLDSYSESDGARVRACVS